MAQTRTPASSRTPHVVALNSLSSSSSVAVPSQNNNRSTRRSSNSKSSTNSTTNVTVSLSIIDGRKAESSSRDPRVGREPKDQASSTVSTASSTTGPSAVEAPGRTRGHDTPSSQLLDKELKHSRRRPVGNSCRSSESRRHRSRDGRAEVVAAEDKVAPVVVLQRTARSSTATTATAGFDQVVASSTHGKKVKTMTESPPASPATYLLSSSGGEHRSDRDETPTRRAGHQIQHHQHQQHDAAGMTMKPSRMVVKRRATVPSCSNSETHRPSARLTHMQSSLGNVNETEATGGSLQVVSSSPRAGTTSGTTGSLEKWQIRLQRSLSGNSSGTDEERHGRDPSSSQRLYSSRHSRQLMESPPPPGQVAATSRRRRGSDSPSLDQTRTRVRSSARGSTQPASSGGSGGLLPPPPPLSLSFDAQDSTTPRSLARKVIHSGETAAGDCGATPKPQPVRIRYETPDRGMGGKREISHASLGKLIARLTDAHQYDTEFRDVFLLTYRSFCSPYDFIKKLLKRYTAVLSLCGGIDPEIIKETQLLLDQITLEEKSEQRPSNMTSISTARSDIATGMEANVSIMRLLSVLKFWIKESGFIDQDLANDRRAQKKLMNFLREIRNTSPIPSIRRHAENLLLTVAQLLSSQKQQAHAQARAQSHGQTQAHAKAQSQRATSKLLPVPAFVTSASVSALPDKSFSTSGGDVGQDSRNVVALALAHQPGDHGVSHSRVRSHATTKLALPRSSSDPKRERSMVKLRTKISSGDIFQLRSRSIPVAAGDQTVAVAATNDRMLRESVQQQSLIFNAAAKAPKISRGVTTGSAEAAVKANTGTDDFFDEIIQDTLQRGRLTAISRKSARIGYDNMDPLSGLSAQEIADQLTLMEADQYFSKLNPRELTSKAWTRENKHSEAPHVMALIELFDATAEWVSSEILHPQLQAVERAKVITLFIDAADNCYHMNNFNTLFEITTGLSAPCTRQLNTTWSLVTAATQEKYQCLQQVCSPDDNYRSYRQAFALAEGQPRLACWFIFVKDVFTYEESMKSTEGGLVNWQKCRKIYRIISETLDRQNFDYVPASSSGAGAGSNGTNTNGIPRKGRGTLRHDRRTQAHIRHRVDTVPVIEISSKKACAAIAPQNGGTSDRGYSMSALPSQLSLESTCYPYCTKPCSKLQQLC
uniref:Ras-GEF domain-containing protein n=1 Tax=Hyaloperonospora arabidopsidis (strain Emoy2) TaxID=559515 RepID=M4BGE5_HYAAE